jgi:hypothetical protein
MQPRTVNEDLGGPPLRLQPAGLLLQFSPLLQGRELGCHTKPPLTGGQALGHRLVAAARSLPLCLVPRAPPPDVLDGLQLQAAEARAVVALPMPRDSADHHVANYCRLVGLPETSGWHAACDGTGGSHIDAGRISEALPPLGDPSKVKPLQGFV